MRVVLKEGLMVCLFPGRLETAPGVQRLLEYVGRFLILVTNSGCGHRNLLAMMKF